MKNQSRFPNLGSQYACYRDNQFICVATFVNDKHHGECFMSLSENSELMPIVCDTWINIESILK